MCAWFDGVADDLNTKIGRGFSRQKSGTKQAGRSQIVEGDWVDTVSGAVSALSAAPEGIIVALAGQLS